LPVEPNREPKLDLGPTCFYFGTFNPVHIGHLILAQAALCQFQFERVVFIPAGQPPHRLQDADMLAASERADLVRLAIADNPHFEMDTLELDEDGPSYTVETLQRLRKGRRYGNLSGLIPLIIGSDALVKLASWHLPQQLAEEVYFLQARRAGDEFVEYIKLSNSETCQHSERIMLLNTALLEAPFLQISSTQIRQQVREARGDAQRIFESLRYKVAEPVCKHIVHGKLYQDLF
jgi:nicotinate-nucleotide adenylyltransferase